MKVKVISCLLSKCRKNGFSLIETYFCEVKLKMLRTNTYMAIYKKHLLLTPKPKQMMNINVKVNVKVTNGKF